MKYILSIILLFSFTVGFSQPVKVLVSQKKKSSVTYATWNPSDKSSLITLSGGNLIAQCTDDVTEYLVRSTIGKSTGKWYWEITYTRVVGGAENLLPAAVSQASESVNAWPSLTAGATIASNGQTYKNGTPGADYVDQTDGDVIGVALDCTPGSFTVKWYRNNTLLHTETLADGTYYASTGTYRVLATITVNFGATAFVYTPPAGYNAGLY